MQSRHVLVVEDNPGDVDLTRDALESGQWAARVEVVDDGAKALDYLQRRHPYESSDRPDLVLLDLNIPKINGQQVLLRMRRDPELCGLPVVVLSTSDAPHDVSRSYELGANCYVTKPVGARTFDSTVRAIARFWLGVARLS